MLRKEDPRHLYASPSAGQTTANRQFTEGGPRGVSGPGTDRDFRREVAHAGPAAHRPRDRPVDLLSRTSTRSRSTMACSPRRTSNWSAPTSRPGTCSTWPRGSSQATGQPRRAPLQGGDRGAAADAEVRRVLAAGPARLSRPGDRPDRPARPVLGLEGLRHPRGPQPLLRPDRAARAHAEADLHDRRAVRRHGRPGPLRPGARCQNARTVWTIRDEQGRESPRARLETQDHPDRRADPRWERSARLSTGPRTVQADREPGPRGHRVRQRVGDLGIPPRRRPTAPPPGLVVSRTWDDATKAALAAGKTVVLFPQARSTHSSRCPAGSCRSSGARSGSPRRSPNTMGILCDPNHPLLPSSRPSSTATGSGTSCSTGAAA